MNKVTRVHTKSNQKIVHFAVEAVAGAWENVCKVSKQQKRQSHGEQTTASISAKQTAKAKQTLKPNTNLN